MVTLTINERKVLAKQGETIFNIAKENNIYIPALCSNEAVEPYGACRLCLVEINTNGRKKLVTSCIYQVEEGLVVVTNTDRIISNRKMIMELLLARCPTNKEIQDLSRKLGVKETRFNLEDNQCILCSLCVRACQEVVGVSAISLVNRGVNREVATPFYQPSEACIGCGSCAYICPVNAISFEDIGDTRYIKWPTSSTEFKLKTCNKCGTYWAPEKQLDYIVKQSNLAQNAFENCPDCRD
jgi:NADH dehydrogenase/NADH:ubiquinone oxidoreductase subunit G